MKTTVVHRPQGGDDRTKRAPVLVRVWCSVCFVLYTSNILSSCLGAREQLHAVLPFHERMTSLPRVGVTSRRRSGAKSPAPLEQAPTPVQLAVPPPRWSLTSRIKERDIWGLGLSSDLPVDEDALFAPKVIPRADRSPDAPYSSLSRRVGAIRLSSDTDVRTPDANGSHSAHRHPLQGKCLPSAEDVTATEVFSDVSRPALRRLTSDMERIAGEGSSRRGSASESRKGKEKAEVEVEVLIHQVGLY